MDKSLWKFYWDCGRSGEVEGLFTATEDEVKEIIGKNAYFGEILGKHSDVYGTIEENEVAKIDINPEIVKVITEKLGKTWCGYNPLDYVQYECSVCGESLPIGEFDKEIGKCTYCKRKS